MNACSFITGVRRIVWELPRESLHQKACWRSVTHRSHVITLYYGNVLPIQWIQKFKSQERISLDISNVDYLVMMNWFKFGGLWIILKNASSTEEWSIMKIRVQCSVYFIRCGKMSLKWTTDKNISMLWSDFAVERSQTFLLMTLSLPNCEAWVRYTVPDFIDEEETLMSSQHCTGSENL